jgi:hypothetical protein
MSTHKNVVDLLDAYRRGEGRHMTSSYSVVVDGRKGRFDNVPDWLFEIQLPKLDPDRSETLAAVTIVANSIEKGSPSRLKSDLDLRRRELERLENTIAAGGVTQQEIDEKIARAKKKLAIAVHAFDGLMLEGTGDIAKVVKVGTRALNREAFLKRCQAVKAFNQNEYEKQKERVQAQLKYLTESLEREMRAAAVLGGCWIVENAQWVFAPKGT